MVTFIAPVIVYPGEDEMEALAMNGYMVMKGEVEPKFINNIFKIIYLKGIF